jgi:hypothetical protein
MNRNFLIEQCVWGRYSGPSEVPFKSWSRSWGLSGLAQTGMPEIQTVTALNRRLDAVLEV